jgi:hypothetical protein
MIAQRIDHQVFLVDPLHKSFRAEITTGYFLRDLTNSKRLGNNANVQGCKLSRVSRAGREVKNTVDFDTRKT